MFVNRQKSKKNNALANYKIPNIEPKQEAFFKLKTGIRKTFFYHPSTANFIDDFIFTKMV